MLCASMLCVVPQFAEVVLLFFLEANGDCARFWRLHKFDIGVLVLSLATYVLFTRLEILSLTVALFDFGFLRMCRLSIYIW